MEQQTHGGGNKEIVKLSNGCRASRITQCLPWKYSTSICKLISGDSFLQSCEFTVVEMQSGSAVQNSAARNRKSRYRQNYHLSNFKTGEQCTLYNGLTPHINHLYARQSYFIITLLFIFTNLLFLLLFC